MRRWRLLFAAAAGAALAAAIGSAWLLAANHPEGAWLRAALAPFCHQQAERCFDLAGRPWGLCVRCSGWWIGVLAASTASPGLLGQRAVAPLFVAAVTLGLSELFTGLAALRFASGMLLGAAVAGCVSITLNDRNPAAERWLSGRKQRFAKPS